MISKFDLIDVVPTTYLCMTLVYGVKSARSSGTSTEPRDSDRSLLIPILAGCLLKPRWLGTKGNDELVTVPGAEDLGESGVRSFHATTIFQTDANGDRGEVCGRRRGDETGIPVTGPVAVNVLVGVNLCVNVSVKVPGLR